MNVICKDRESLRLKYEQFIQTERGKKWKHFWQVQKEVGILEITFMTFIQKCCSKQRIYNYGR